MTESENIATMRDGRELIQKADELISRAEEMYRETLNFVPDELYQDAIQKLENAFEQIENAHQWLSNPTIDPIAMKKHSPNEMRAAIAELNRIKGLIQAKLEKYISESTQQ